jgi:hypothetical protein
MIYIVLGNTNNIFERRKKMNIRIEGLDEKWKTSIIKIGGVVSTHLEFPETISATFFHHEIKTKGDRVEIADSLTDKVIFIKRRDFYGIAIV